MRVFIALELPEHFMWETAALARQLGERMVGRFVEPQNYHITLAFLGNVDERGVQAAADALDAACANRAPVPLRCDGLSKFGNADDATFWLGIERNEKLDGLASAVRDELSAREVAFDQKPFKPHITLARRATIPKGALPPLPFPEPDCANAATLFKSELDPDGAIYTPLHTVILS